VAVVDHSFRSHRGREVPSLHNPHPQRCGRRPAGVRLCRGLFQRLVDSGETRQPVPRLLLAGGVEQGVPRIGGKVVEVGQEGPRAEPIPFSALRAGIRLAHVLDQSGLEPLPVRFRETPLNQIEVLLAAGLAVHRGGDGLSERRGVLEQVAHHDTARCLVGRDADELGQGVGGRVDSQAKILALGNAETRIVAGTGGLASKAEVKTERDALEKVFDRMSDAMRKGFTTEDMQKAKLLDGLARTWANPDKFIYDAHKSMWAHYNKLSHTIV